MRNKKILIHAGAGGVGNFAIQYAKKVLGMYVATTASKPKEALLKELGADLVVDYKTEHFEDIVSDYDVVLDPMSWLYEERTLNSNVLKPTGYYLNVPSSDWSFDGTEKTNGLNTYRNLVISKIKNLFQPGSMPKYSMVFVSPNGEDLQLVLDLIDNGTIKPIIDKKFHLSEAEQAHRYLEQGRATGKVVLYHTELTEEKQERAAKGEVEEQAHQQQEEQEEEATSPENEKPEEQPPMEEATE
jgi:alcohol dehydrogenase